MATARPLRSDPVADARRHWEASGWPDAAGGMAVVTSVMRVQQIFLARAEAALRPFGLTFARYEALMLLMFSRQGRLPLGKIGERLQVHAASATNVVDRLEAQHLVARVPNPRDGRGRLAEITPAGRTVAGRATSAMNEQLFTKLGLAPADLERLTGLLGGIRRAAGDFDDTPGR